jgi:hypothetical protein
MQGSTYMCSFCVNTGVSYESSLTLPAFQDDGGETKVKHITSTADGKIIAISDLNSVFLLNIEEEKRVQTIPIGQIKNLAFATNNDRGHIFLFVSYGKKYMTALEVDIDPSLLQRSFHLADEKVIPLISKHKHLLLKRDEKGRTLIALAVEFNRTAILKEIIKTNPSLAWISLELLVYFLTHSDENAIADISTNYKCVPARKSRSS